MNRPSSSVWTAAQPAAAAQTKAWTWSVVAVVLLLEEESGRLRVASAFSAAAVTAFDHNPESLSRFIQPATISPTITTKLTMFFIKRGTPIAGVRDFASASL